MPWGVQDASRHAPSLGTVWGIPGLGGDGPGVRMALAQKSLDKVIFLPGASNPYQKALRTLRS